MPPTAACAPRTPPSGGDCSPSRAPLPLRLPLCSRLAGCRLLGRVRTRPCAVAPWIPTPCVSRCRPVLPRPAAEKPPLLRCLIWTSAPALLCATRALPAATAHPLRPLELAGARPRCATFRLGFRLPFGSLLLCSRSSPHRCRHHPPCRRALATALTPRRLPSPCGRALATAVPRHRPGTSARATPGTRSAVLHRRPSAPPPAGGSGCGGLPAPVCA